MSRPSDTAGSPAQLDIRRPLLSLHSLLTHPSHVPLAQILVLLGEAILCLAIVRFIRFTNIDWTAYMQQVHSVIKGERDYAKIRGETGPLVYPAGFIWIYGLFYRLTDDGKDIRAAQYIFAGIYIATMAVVFRLYRSDLGIPPYAYGLLALSKRLHSLYILRCFNDCVAMFFLYTSIWALCRRRTLLASGLLSLALSVKMSILLFGPAFALVVLLMDGLFHAVRCGLFIVAVQLLLALPFLTHDHNAYVSRAFEFSRVFLYKWTVNWRFLSEESFLSNRFSTALLIGHASTLVLAMICWSRPFGGIYATLDRAVRYPERAASFGKPLSARYIVTALFSCNLIGMLFARSLHYQFYAWEAHQLVFLLWQTRLWLPFKLLLLVAIEYGWETFPATWLSSASLVSGHVLLVGSVLLQADWRAMV